jgi:hypothetical protein
MNKAMLRTFGAAAVLVVGLSACGNQAPASSQSEGAPAREVPETATLTPTPTPAKTYTSEELAAIVGQIQDVGGVRLTVMSGPELAQSMEQVKALMAQIVVEPAACQEMALAGSSYSLAGVSAAIGAGMNAETGATNALALSSGLEAKLLETAVAPQALPDECGTMTVTTAGVTVTMKTTEMKAVGSVPGTLAYRTDTTLPDGRNQSMIIARAVMGGVLINVTASGGATEEEATARTGALLDQAAALVK